jgi:hypothetical protein
MFADIGKFFEKNLINPIREATDKDFALRHEKTRLRNLERQYAQARPAFFEAQEDFAIAVAQYERVSEDFSQVHGRRVLRKIAGGGPPGLANAGAAGGNANVLEAIGNGGRDVLKTVTFGLTEAIFNIEETPRERKALNRQIGRLSKSVNALNAATKDLRGATAKYNASPKSIQEQFARLGDDVTASDVHVQTARSLAQREIIESLIEQNIPAETIAEMTGISPQIITDVMRSTAADAPS